MGQTKKLIRVFPRKTRQTPTDEGVLIRPLPLVRPDAEEIRISVAFTYDLPWAYHMQELWGEGVSVGGPATGQPSGEFVPGLYLKRGNIITSRGCPNRCAHCSVWRREPGLRELPIHDGWNIQDDNLLACSRKHIRAVFAMLLRQKRPVVFTGGLEAARLEDWHIDLLSLLRSPTLWFAYDTPDDFEPLVVTAKKLRDAGFHFAGHRICCYVLCGTPKDDMRAAEARIRSVMELGYFPQAMVYRDQRGKITPEWRTFGRQWANKTIVGAMIRPYLKGVKI